MMPTSIGILRAHSVPERDVLERADLLVTLAVLGREREPALEQVERAARVAALYLRLPPRDRRVGRGREIAGLLGDLERAAEVALGAVDIAEVAVALADVAELERDPRALAERLVDLERA